MNHKGVERLHAFVDGQLSGADKARLLEEMERDPSLREEVCQIRRMKEYVTCAFETVPPAPARPHRQSHWPRYIHGAAALLLLTFGFLAGRWSDPAAGQRLPDPHHHVILHVNSADNGKFLVALADAEALVTEPGDDMRVEVVFNGTGLDLIRSDRSPAIDRVRGLMEHYPNIRFVACNLSIAKLTRRGDRPPLMQGIQVTPSASDHILRRLEEGWSYVRV